MLKSYCRSSNVISIRPSRCRECLLEQDDLARMVQVVLRRAAKLYKRRILGAQFLRKALRGEGPHCALELLIRGFHDEALRGEWRNHRSSRLGDQFRVIYKIESNEILVLVIDITAHDYRRK